MFQVELLPIINQLEKLYDALQKKVKVRIDMNLDEAIKYEEELANMYSWGSGDIKKEQQHKQIAEWLKELKKYRPIFTENATNGNMIESIFPDCSTRHVFQEVYLYADNFRKKIVAKFNTDWWDAPFESEESNAEVD